MRDCSPYHFTSTEECAGGEIGVALFVDEGSRVRRFGRGRVEGTRTNGLIRRRGRVGGNGRSWVSRIRLLRIGRKRFLVDRRFPVLRTEVRSTSSFLATS